MQHANYLIVLPRLCMRLQRHVRVTACYVTESLICMLSINLFSKHIQNICEKQNALSWKTNLKTTNYSIYPCFFLRILAMKNRKND